MTRREHPRPRRSQRLVLLAALVAMVAAALAYAACLRDVHSLRSRLGGESRVAATPLGLVEFAEGGRGPAVLMLHGAGGGITPFSTAQFTAEHLPQAEFLPLSSGGHLLLGHHAAVAARIARFLETSP